jgi:hypothetical protein
MVEAYCVKCKTKREMKDPRQEKTVKGGDIVKGNCPTCGCGMCRMGKMPVAAK